MRDPSQISNEVARRPSTEVIQMGPGERPRSDLESWNVGLITAYRPELSPADNEARDRELWSDLTHFGRLHLRGRYIEGYGTPRAVGKDVKAHVVVGNSDDSGNLKGMLRKWGRKFHQDAVIHKGYYRDAELHALADLPALGLGDGKKTGLGRFHPNRLGAFYTLMTRCGFCPPPSHLEEVGLEAKGTDWLGGRWDEIGLWTPRTFFNRTSRRIEFDEAGSRYEA